MAYEPLHHKYRPQTFAELVGQEAIATTLTNALRQQKIAPAYLLTGARGTGKTSSARILAKSLNCLSFDFPSEKPCGKCDVCRSIAKGSALDVIEIDAASNTGVDNIRELIERAQFAPVQCRYKVYVIDECHMLSTAAFNALLKTLEEPPNRVVFVLATTDPQRVLPTIISRCQRFDFRRIELVAMVQHLSQIAAKEAIDISPDAIQLVAQIAQGGLRDAESMLDQLSLLEGQIIVERVWDLVGAVPERDLLALVQAIVSGQPTAVIDRVRQVMDRGREPLIVLQNLASFYRDLLIAKTTPERNDLVAITPPTWTEMCSLVHPLNISLILKGQQHLRSSEAQVKNTTQPRLWLEVTLLGLLASEELGVGGWELGVGGSAARALSNRTPSNGSAAKPSVSAAPPPTFYTSPPTPSLPTPPPAPLTSTPPSPSPTPNPQPPAPVNLDQTWQAILELLQPPGTQALFKQQGRLLALEPESARIGISSQPLFKMAQLRVTNLEAAFAKFVERPIKVSLEVVAPPISTAEAATLAPPDVALTETVATLSKPVVQKSTSGKNGSHAVSEAAAPYETGEATTKSPPASEPSQPQQWQDEDEVSRSAKSLAQMFNGQIVRWDEDLQSPVEEGSLERSSVNLDADLPAEDGDPDDDVPF